jgi:hypothetical protein
MTVLYNSSIEKLGSTYCIQRFHDPVLILLLQK